MMNKIVILICSLLLGTSVFGQVHYTGKQPGVAKVRKTDQLFVLENDCLYSSWSIQDHQLVAREFKDKVNNRKLQLRQLPLFHIDLKDGTTLKPSDFKLVAANILSIKGDHNSQKYAGKCNEKKIRLQFTCQKPALTLYWEASLTDGANYVKQSFTISTKSDLYITKASLLNLPVDENLTVQGQVEGSPIVSGTLFFALEHPMGKTEVLPNRLSNYLPRLEPVTPAKPFKSSVVWGVSPAGQLRRAFLYYTERERASPYHQNLHYNSWYDLSWIDRKLDEKSCLQRIQLFADSLVEKRKVRLDNFLFDDGWDNNQTLWQFNKSFPNGFTPLAKLAANYRAKLGVWISPWGGYLEDQRQRLEYGKQQNPPFEINKNGFSLTGPIYYNRFKQVAQDFVNKYQVAMFKFDGVGAGNGASGASVTYQSDIEALLNLIAELKTSDPKLFFSLTVGTWPSIYWLNYGDAIWRAGKDTDFAGSGSKRQQWMTYRDAQTYKNVVLRAPLFPLNSLMYHGICIAENGPPGKFGLDPKDISDEIWSFFGNGTNLQELYINPTMLTNGAWDELAAAARWSKRNADVWADSHWIGGDPIKGEVYGFAGWKPGKGVLMLRNPSGQAKTFQLDVADIFDIPKNQNADYHLYNAKLQSEKRQPLYTGRSFKITLEPYEVKVFDAKEVK